MLYNINETFYSLKGEGVWAGTPMFFIRLAGCNMKCKWCDTYYGLEEQATEEELAYKASGSLTERVVITGGEPGLQNTLPLVTALHSHQMKVHVETNGTTALHTLWDWIAVSPKGPVDKLDSLVMKTADEIKFIVGIPDWEQYITEVCAKFNLLNRALLKLWVMPLAKPYPFRLSDGLINENIQLAIKYCLEHPEFSLCLQQHKILGIK